MTEKTSSGYASTIAAKNIAIVIIVLFIAAGIFVPAYFESNAYNRITGANVSAWDAVWLELRIDCSTPIQR